MKIDKLPAKINKKLPHEARSSKAIATQKNKFKTKADARKPFEEIAEGMETQFVHHMLKQMRQTVPQDKPDSSEVGYYKSLVDYERAKILATDPKGGIGIKKMVLNEILPNYLKENNSPSNKTQMLNAYKDSLKENSHE